jgi:flagellar basal body-associated protein FliL
MANQNQNTSGQESKSGPSIAMIVGIIVVIVAIFAAGFFVLSKDEPGQLPEEDPPATLPEELPEQLPE